MRSPRAFLLKLAVELAALDGLTVPEQAAVFVAFVESLVEVDRLYLAKYPSAAKLVRETVRYEQDAGVIMVWRDVLALLRARKGDCKDLVAARVAEYREAGRDARVHVVFYRDEAQLVDTFHLQVVVDGVLEDPSRDAGMSPVFGPTDLPTYGPTSVRLAGKAPV